MRLPLHCGAVTPLTFDISRLLTTDENYRLSFYSNNGEGGGVHFFSFDYRTVYMTGLKVRKLT